MAAQSVLSGEVFPWLPNGAWQLLKKRMERIQIDACSWAADAVEEHGRQAYAIPGRIGDGASAGCIQAIHDGWLELALEPFIICKESQQAWHRLSTLKEEDFSTFEELQ